MSYTPETYTVEYGVESTQLGDRSPQQGSGSDIRVVDKVYSQELVGLAPQVTYYYRVVATNSAGSTASVVRSVQTMACAL